MKEWPDNCVDLVVTSPPYNIGIEYDNYTDNLPWGEYLKWCGNWINECARLLKKSGRIVVNILTDIKMVAGEKQYIREVPVVDFANLIRKSGLIINAITSWTDVTRTKYTAWGSWRSAKAPYIYNPFEVIIIAYKEQWEKQNEGENTISAGQFIRGTKGYYSFNTNYDPDIPATFPIGLPLLFIEILSYKNDLVLDCFDGSGQTCLAAKKLGRCYIGIDISEKYCEIARMRLKAVDTGVPVKEQKIGQGGLFE